MKVITSELEGPAFVGSSSAPPVNSALETNDTDVEMHTLPINEPSSSSQGVASTAGASSANPGAPQLSCVNHLRPQNISISCNPHLDHHPGTLLWSRLLHHSVTSVFLVVIIDCQFLLREQ